MCKMTSCDSVCIRRDGCLHTLWQSRVNNAIVLFGLSLSYVPDNADVLFLTVSCQELVSPLSTKSVLEMLSWFTTIHMSGTSVHVRMSCLLWSSVAAVVICVSILQWSATEKPVKIDKWDGAAVKNTLDDTSKKVLTRSYFPLVFPSRTRWDHSQTSPLSPRD